MRFTCPNCGARFGSADEPGAGRVYSIRCRCGTKLNLAAAPPAPAPAVTTRYDPWAASQGLLLGEAEARSLAAGQPILEPATRAVAGEEVEVTVTFSTVLAPPRKAERGEKAKRPAKDERGKAKEGAGLEGDAEKKPTARPAGRVPPAWAAPAAALLAFTLAGGGTAWALLPQAGVDSPEAFLARLDDLAAGRSRTPLPAAAGEPAVPVAPPPQVAAVPEPPQEVLRPADPPRRTSAKPTGAQGGKPARERKLARRMAADRR